MVTSAIIVSSDSSDESVGSPPSQHITPLPASSPFLCIDSFEDSNSFNAPPSQDPYMTAIAHWRSKSSSGDSLERPRHSSSLSAGPSRKRCRSPTDYVPSSTPVTGSLAPTRADLLPPCKRFRDSYSPETSMEEDTKI
nr:hypothetical protein [Tanacetum cinerariifolium]